MDVAWDIVEVMDQSGIDVTRNQRERLFYFEGTGLQCLFRSLLPASIHTQEENTAMATDKKPTVLVVGGGTYLGHNILCELKGLFDFTATYTLLDHETFSTTRPWRTYTMTGFDMKGTFKGLLMLGGYNWVVFSPEAYSTQRTLVAQLLVETLRESKFEGGVIVLSHDGADHLAEKDGRKQLAELFTVEKAIFGMKHLSRVYILR